MAIGGDYHSQLGRGDCDDGSIRCETLCPPLPRRTLRYDETGARTNVVDHLRDSSTTDGETLVTRPAVHGTSADRQLTQHSTSSTSQLHQPSPPDDSYRDPSDGKDAVVVTMTEQLSTSRSSRLEALRDASTFLEILLGVNEMNPGVMLQ